MESWTDGPGPKFGFVSPTLPRYLFLPRTHLCITFDPLHPIHPSLTVEMALILSQGPRCPPLLLRLMSFLALCPEGAV